jgi:hypothetical protein
MLSRRLLTATRKSYASYSKIEHAHV